MKLWELEDKYHCPVVGTCFSLAEIKKLARRGGYAGEAFDAYRLHLEAVNISCSRNDLSEVMQKSLERKYQATVRRFEQAKSEAAVLALWREYLERGEVPGAIWAAFTHRAASKETRHAVYADVHMLSHQVGAGQAADLRRLEWLAQEHARLREENRQAEARLTRETVRWQARERDLARDAADAANLRQEAAYLRQRLQVLESGMAMTAMSRRLLALGEAAARAEEEKRRREVLALELDALRREAEALRLELAEVRAERDALERYWSREEATPDPAADGRRVVACQDCEQCAHRAEPSRCVLCVGGRPPLLPQYRQLAERLGIRLLHHDGGREEALSRLPGLLNASDAVICPTDCVGHPAYYQLKQHCKQAGKPCLLTRGSGVASFAAALGLLVDGRLENTPQD